MDDVSAMDNSAGQLTQANGNWRQRIDDLQALLDQTGNELIDAEAELAERRAALDRFDFRLRSRLGKLTDRLNGLQAEIAALHQRLRDLYNDWDPADDPWTSAEEPAAGREDGGRESWDYREAMGNPGNGGRGPAGPAAEPPSLSGDEKTEIKQLYRQLARRFHPDLGLDEADRAYRTELMAAVNRAYATGDLARLRALLLEPAAEHTASVTTDEERAEALLNELNRCRRRLAEIRHELAQLIKQRNYRLMARAERLESEGRDLLSELAREVSAEIARKMAERDALQMEVEEYERDGVRLPDALYDLGLEEELDELVSPEFEHWLDKQRLRTEWDEDNPEYPDTRFE
jgi:curved DNA-binding protein CbpA